MATESEVRDVLKNVEDPEIGLDIVNLGLIRKITVNGDRVDIDMTLTSPGCPLAGQILAEIEVTIKLLDEIKTVELNLVWDPPWDPSQMSEEAQEALGFF